MSLIILFVGIYGIITSHNLIKKIMCLALVESTVILHFLGVGFQSLAAAPILGQGSETYVDPVPQALMLTAIVIGVCFNALATAFIVRLYQQRGSVDVRDLNDL